jgi:hypothetical protein
MSTSQKRDAEAVIAAMTLLVWDGPRLMYAGNGREGVAVARVYFDTRWCADPLATVHGYSLPFTSHWLTEDEARSFIEDEVKAILRLVGVL